MKPDYKLEQSKAKRAADLIEFGERVLAILKENSAALHSYGEQGANTSRARVHREAYGDISASARSLGLLDKQEEKL